jgi:2-polyprenyl-3-methyl-5-hydroxy-6-metoxy-1,4-benzoquinol methylase
MSTGSTAELGNLEANIRFLDSEGLPTPGQRVLEIGSGRGTLLHALLDRGIEAQGIETSADRIAEACARFGPIPIRHTTGASLPFDPGTFDVVLSFDVFEHIPDSDAHLAEVRRVLKPGGWYLLQTPNKWSNTIFETIRWRSFTRWRADHCSLHSAAQLEARFRRHGFSTTFADVPVVTTFYREKVRRHLGPAGAALLRVANPDRLPVRWRTNLYVRARKR